MFNDCRPREAVKRLVGNDYIQHNPHVGSGIEGFVADFERMAREFPGKHVEIKHVVAEGDLVVIHCRQTWPGSDDYAAIDVFRCDGGGRIVEHWDVLQILGAQGIKLSDGSGPSADDLKNREELRASAERLVRGTIINALVDHVCKQDPEFRSRISLAIEARIPKDDSGSEQADMFSEFVRASPAFTLDRP